LTDNGAATLAREAANNPESVLTPQFRKLLDLAPENQRNQFLSGVRQSILDSGDPVKLLDSMKISSNPEPFYYLFGGREGYNNFMRTAERVSRAHNSTMGQIYQRRTDQFETTKYALEQIQTPAQARDLWGQLEPSEQTMFRGAIVDNLVDKALGPNSKGQYVVNTVVLENEIKKLRNNGVWRMLSPEQQERLTGLSKYYRVAMGKTQDVGASLENASIVADLKGFLTPTPSQFRGAVEAMHAIFQNKMLAAYVTNPKRAEKLMRQMQQVPRDLRPWAASTLVALPFAVTGAKEGYGEAEKAVEEADFVTDMLTGLAD
jgi:hypothetical protein